MRRAILRSVVMLAAVFILLWPVDEAASQESCNYALGCWSWCAPAHGMDPPKVRWLVSTCCRWVGNVWTCRSTSEGSQGCCWLGHETRWPAPNPAPGACSYCHDEYN